MPQMTMMMAILKNLAKEVARLSADVAAAKAQGQARPLEQGPNGGGQTSIPQERKRSPGAASNARSRHF